MTIQQHAAAIIGLLTADTMLTVYDGRVPDDAPNAYVLIYCDDADPEDAESRPLTGASGRQVTGAICHCVSGTQAGARVVADRVRTALLDVVPVVAGRVCAPIRREDGQPVQRDESTGVTVQDLVTVYRLESVPA